MDPSLSPTSPTEAPDWSSQTEEIHCPLCDYNLRGLVEPRCPECGYSFEWTELTDPGRKKHPYLFEHHPERNVRSFIRTVIGQLRPRRFWRSVRPEMPSNRRRVMIYWCITAGLCTLWLAVPVIFDAIDAPIHTYRERASARRSIEVATPGPNGSGWWEEVMVVHGGSVDAAIDAHSPSPMRLQFWEALLRRIRNGVVALPQSWRFTAAILFLAWPWATLLVMQIFRASMRQARILPIHLQRSILYSFDAIVLLLVVGGGIHVTQSIRLMLYGQSWYRIDTWYEPIVAAIVGGGHSLSASDSISIVSATSACNRIHPAHTIHPRPERVRADRALVMVVGCAGAAVASADWAHVVTQAQNTNFTPAPDWSTQTEEIHCTLCDYNLRGLTEPRCPECGHRFEWIKLTDPALRVHPYLFEHHPRRNVWSYARTLLGGMLPGRFWRSLQPIQRIERRRLVVYYGVTLFMLLLPFAALFVQASISVATLNQRNRPFFTANGLRLNPEYTRARIASGLHEADLDQYYPLPPSWRFFRSVLDHPLVRALVKFLLAIALWPWVAATILMIFRASMLRARIKPAHVMRCTIYTADSGPLLAAMGTAGGVWVVDQVYPSVLPSINSPMVWCLGLVIIWGMITWRLMQAYREYLRFPHAVGVALSVQVIFMLLALQSVVLIGGYEAVENLIWALRSW